MGPGVERMCGSTVKTIVRGLSCLGALSGGAHLHLNAGRLWKRGGGHVLRGRLMLHIVSVGHQLGDKRTVKEVVVKALSNSPGGVNRILTIRTKKYLAVLIVSKSIISGIKESHWLFEGFVMLYLQSVSCTLLKLPYRHGGL